MQLTVEYPIGVRYAGGRVSGGRVSSRGKVSGVGYPGVPPGVKAAVAVDTYPTLTLSCFRLF